MFGGGGGQCSPQGLDWASSQIGGEAGGCPPGVQLCRSTCALSTVFPSSDLLCAPLGSPRTGVSPGNAPPLLQAAQRPPHCEGPAFGEQLPSAVLLADAWPSPGCFFASQLPKQVLCLLEAKAAGVCVDFVSPGPDALEGLRVCFLKM